MTQEEKDLLLKDLCARLPYDVKACIDFKAYLDIIPEEDYVAKVYQYLKIVDKSIEDYSREADIICGYPCYARFCFFRNGHEDYGVPVEYIRPYLRPMTSMTDDEKEHLQILQDIISDENYGDGYSPAAWGAISEFEDYCHEHHLDNRGLIHIGLALEAPEGMY